MGDYWLDWGHPVLNQKPATWWASGKAGFGVPSMRTFLDICFLIRKIFTCVLFQNRFSERLTGELRHPVLIQKTAIGRIWEKTGMSLFTCFSLYTWSNSICTLRFEKILLAISVKFCFSWRLPVGLQPFNAEFACWFLSNSCVFLCVFSAVVFPVSFARLKTSRDSIKLFLSMGN